MVVGISNAGQTESYELGGGTRDLRLYDADGRIRSATWIEN
jgi:hypothetical protein